MADESKPDLGWTICELMGHRRLGAYVTEQEIAGHGFLRLEIPGADGAPSATQFVSPSSVYCLTPVTEAMARAVALRNQPEPVQRWELPKLPDPNAGNDYCRGCQGPVHGGLCRNCGERHPCSCMEDEADDDTEPVPDLTC